MAKIDDTVDSFALKYAIPADLVERICDSFSGGCKFMHISYYFVRKGEDLLALDILHLGKGHYKSILESRDADEIAQLEYDIHGNIDELTIEEGKIYQRLGFFQEAMVSFDKVHDKYQTDIEYMGLRASLYKSMAFAANSEEEKLSLLTQSQELYYRVYRNNKEQYWHGINTVLVNFVKGDMPWCRNVLHDLDKEIASRMQNGERDYWLTATYAEVKVYWFLLTDEMDYLDAATELYAEAQLIDNDISKIRSSIKNINLLLETTNQNTLLSHYSALWFPKINVILLPGRMTQDETAQFKAKVEKLNLPDVPKHINIIAVPSKSNRDLLSQMGSQLDHVDWLYLSNEDFNTLEADVGKVKINSRDDDKFWFLSGRQLATNQTVIDYWSDCFTGLQKLIVRQFTHYDVTTFGRWIPHECETFTEEFPTLSPARVQNESVNGHLKSFLMGDLSGYSKYDDFQVKTFAQKVFGGISKIADKYGSLIQRDGWGDAFYFVFDDQKECLDCAMEIKDLISQWQREDIHEQWKLPAAISMRIAVDTAPLTQITDFIEGKTGYTGTFVSRVARMEPITPIGAVYCGIGCALKALENDFTGINFNYMGINSLPKKYGVEHVFKVDLVAA
ncbi:MAG: hypothetical protein GJ680_17805 [Alteromonadaceae bacterium]|nr:hypothetical protein [Alteromonadaceae bacterium]